MDQEAFTEETIVAQEKVVLALRRSLEALKRGRGSTEMLRTKEATLRSASDQLAYMVRHRRQLR